MGLSPNQRDNLSTNCPNHVHEQTWPSSLNMHIPKNTESKRGTEATILQSESLSKKGAWRSTFPPASAKLKNPNYSTIWPNFTSSISTAFIPDSFGDKLKYGTARDNFNGFMLKHFCKELPNNFLFSKFKCNVWPTRVTTAVVPSFHCLANLWSALYLTRLP